MGFPKYEHINSQTLRDLQSRLGLSNIAMAKLVGVSYKTWLNRVSASEGGKVKLLSKLEYAYLVGKAMRVKVERQQKKVIE